MTSSSCRAWAALERTPSEGLDESQRAHLLECASCAARWAELERFRELAQKLPWEKPSSSRIEGVRTRLLREAASLPKRSAIVRSRASLAVGFAIVIAVAAAVLLIQKPAKMPNLSATGPRVSLHEHEGVRFNRVGTTDDQIVRLISGTLTIEIEELQPGQRFRVITGDAEVEVRGTAFDVTSAGDRLRSVRVMRGRSEERRVGKEGRGGWGGKHEKKKT